MSTEKNLAIMKALADRSRLAIVNSLLERPQYAEELARRHALAPSTVSFHLRKLEQAGLVTSRREQYYVVVAVNEAVFDTTLRQLVAGAPASMALQELRLADYRQKVLDTFFRDGRLEKLPAQHKKRRIVLEAFAARFEPRRRYGEEEVSALILPFFDDYCTVRRLLVDEGLVRRAGSSYWREPETDMGGAGQAPAAAREAEVQTNERREIIRRYKQDRPQMGVFQLRCTANGRIYVGASANLEGERNSRLFQLRMGQAVFSRELQRDLEEYGAERIEFTVLATLDPPDGEGEAGRRLAALELHWLEKLQPFGERGYNSRRRYERDRERLQLAGGAPLG